MNDSQTTQAKKSGNSSLQQNPAKVVPRRTIFLAVAITVFGGILAYFFNWNILRLLAGFWIGTIAALINFRLIVINAHKQMDEATENPKPNGLKGYAVRQLISIAAFLLGFLLGIPAMIAAFIGLSMVKFSIQLDTFLTFKS